MYKVDVKPGLNYMLNHYYEEMYNTILRCAKEGKAVQLAYEGADGKRSNRPVKPFEILNSTNGLAFRAVDLETSTPKLFYFSRAFVMSPAYELPVSDEDKVINALRAHLEAMHVDVSQYTFSVDHVSTGPTSIVVDAHTEGTDEYFSGWLYRNDLDTDRVKDLQVYNS